MVEGSSVLLAIVVVPLVVFLFVVQVTPLLLLNVR